MADPGRAEMGVSLTRGDRSATFLPAGSLETDDALQARMLAGVSRTFALTIPELPADLARVVSNAYLLCRIVDTIEDEPVLSGTQKNSFCQQFLRTLNIARNT